MAVSAHSFRMRALLVACTICALAFDPATASGQHKVVVRAKLAHDTVQAGSNVRVTFEVRIEDGWHINSATPSDENAIRTSVHAPKSDVATMFDLQYPPGVEKELGFSDVPVSVYEGNIQIECTLRIASGVKPGPHVLPVSLEYQACNDHICLAPASIVVNIPLHVVSPVGRMPRSDDTIFDRH